MATMKEHLSEMHDRMAQHHKSMAGHFETLSKCMAKASNGEARDGKGTLDALTAEHQSMAAFHSDCASTCAKANDGDLNKLVPNFVSGIAPERPGVRAVPRTGAPVAQATFDPSLTKIFGLDLDDQDSEEKSLQSLR